MTGLHRLTDPKIRTFVIMPIMINIAIFSALIWWLSRQFTPMIEAMTSWLPPWLSFLSVLLWPLFVFAILITVFFSFTLVTNFIAAPFNGFLAERIQAELDPGCVPEMAWQDLLRFIPRTIQRELQRLAYYLPRALILLALSFVPVINLITPLLWLLLSGWMLGIQYCDYAADNEMVNFREMKDRLAQPYAPTIAFGGLVSALTLVPVVNLIIMPAAVIGGTYLWVERRTLQNNSFQ